MVKGRGKKLIAVSDRFLDFWVQTPDRDFARASYCRQWPFIDSL
jgi:hypothetical protein